MDVRQMITDSLAATARSKQENWQAVRLAGQAQHTIRDRAQQLATAKAKAPLEDNIVVAEWLGTYGRLRHIMVTPYDIQAVIYNTARPSGMAFSIHRLGRTPLPNLEEHFGPLMRPDYAIPKDRSIWTPTAKKITQLKLSNPSHLQLLWDVIGTA